MQLLNDLAIFDLILGLTNLLDEAPGPNRPQRSSALTSVDGDRIYRSDLASLLAALKALPPEAQALPLKELFKLADATFDRDGRIMRLCAELVSLLTKPNASAQAMAASVEVVVPLGITRKSYATEALHAKTIAPTLATHQAGFEAFTLPDDETPDLWSVLKRFVEAGKELDTLGSARGETVALQGDRFGAGALRNRAIGALHALREHVERALRARPDLPRDLDGKIFGYLDELQRLAKGRQGATASDEVAPVTPGVPAPTA